ncbi:hypothetical protein FOA52_003686 [Chlamydomonas sp. UWO 241]|nr:hypothetical protein FOA52_003686 [Chlamydomonas sp. UWO 241]
MYCLKVAAAFNRVLLIHQTAPAPMETFFMPTHINWTTAGIDVPGPEAMSKENEAIRAWRTVLFPPANFEGTEDLVASDHKWLSAGSTNMNEEWEVPGGDKRLPGYGGMGQVPLYSRVGMCIQNAMYKPSERVESVYREKFQQMGMADLPKPYVAIHLRLFQMVGEMREPGRPGGESTETFSIDQEDRFLTAQLCARDMASRQECGAEHSGAQVPIILVTDSIYLRRRVLLGLYAGVSATDVVPHHFDIGLPSDPPKLLSQHAQRQQEEEERIERHVETVADMVTLARSSAFLVDANSGFSRMAAYLGGSAMGHIPPLNATCIGSAGGGTLAELGCYKPAIRTVLPCRSENKECLKERISALYGHKSVGRGYDVPT